VALDSRGLLHVSGNMHSSPLVYFRGRIPYDVFALQDLGTMVGADEISCSYPAFYDGPDGRLVFAYRSGESGNGDHLFNAYDLWAQRWERLYEAPLLDGEGRRNAYPTGPVRGPDGFWHLAWVWRDTANAATNHDLSYARSRDFLRWQTSRGEPLTPPITLATGEVVDSVPVNGGLLNTNIRIGFDAASRVTIGYHKLDLAGRMQVYNARLESSGWVRHQTTDWDFRWEIGGTGTLDLPLELEPIGVGVDGVLGQGFYRVDIGRGRLVLDPATLRAVDQTAPLDPYPPTLGEVASSYPGMRVHWLRSEGSGPDARLTYMLRWETLGPNGDRPRPQVPPPMPLRLFAFRR
jgi:hypothetical protein